MKTLFLSMLIASAVAYADLDDPASLIPGEYESAQGQFFIRIQDSLTIESDFYIRVIGGDSKEYHLPLHFTSGLRWNEFEKRFEVDAYHSLPNGCRVDSPVFLSLFKVKDHQQLEMTVRLPLRVEYDFCRTEGVTFHKWQFNKIAPHEELLVGAIHYTGGFAKKSLSVADTRLAKKFRVQVPAFCKNIEVLEASVKSQGKSVVVTLIDAQKHIFGIQPGAVIEAIQLTLNAPLEMGCDIPVYATFEVAD